MKTCCTCRTEKPLGDFNIMRASKDGRQNQCRACNVNATQARKLRQFGLSQDEYDEMLVAQGGGCAICGGHSRDGSRLAIDHDHSCCAGKFSCGKCVRGLLCGECNRALGKFGDNYDLVARAAAYLKEHL